MASGVRQPPLKDDITISRYDFYLFSKLAIPHCLCETIPNAMKNERASALAALPPETTMHQCLAKSYVTTTRSFVVLCRYDENNDDDDNNDHDNDDDDDEHNDDDNNDDDITNDKTKSNDRILESKMTVSESVGKREKKLTRGQIISLYK